MSADNWTRCPRCEANEQASRLKAIRDAAEKYGKIPAEEWTELRDKASRPCTPRDSLREGYEIGVRDGLFSVDYSCSCALCGFKFTHTHSEAVQ